MAMLQFIREQDKELKDERKKRTAALGDTFTEAQTSYEAQISALKDELIRVRVRPHALDKLPSRVSS